MSPTRGGMCLENRTWELGWSSDPEKLPMEWIPGRVPGCVQLDWAEAKGWGPWWKGNHFAEYRWMEDCWWTYRTILREEDGPLVGLPQELTLMSEQVEWKGEVWLGPSFCGRFEGPGKGISVSLTDAWREGKRDLRIVLDPAPVRASDPAAGDPGRVINTETTKAGVSFGWDFAPRLVPLGLTSPLILCGPGRQAAPGLRSHYDLDLETRTARVHLSVAGPLDSGAVLDWVILGPGGEKVLALASSFEEALLAGETRAVTAPLQDILLWQPNGRGEQPLYSQEVTLRGSGGEELAHSEWRTGFRTFRLTQYEGQWEAAEDFPLSRKEPPITMEVNGHKIFGKGSNWVPPDQLTSLTTKERTKELAALAKEAGFNLLRVWGGGGFPPSHFFDACDEAGILVWQEFPLACARYEPAPQYLKTLEEEARTVVRRLRTHPSLAFWCGGNELFNSWSRMDDQDLALRLLNKVCYEEDAQRPFLATSPLMGMAHGNYTFVDLLTGREVLEVFSKAKATAYTEFGSSGPSSVESLKKIIPPDELWPPREGTAWETHHAIKAWDGTEHSWLMLPTLTRYFGEAKDLDELVWQGQTLQSEGLRFIYEEARRQAPRCSMALCWCFNEPWPTAANNSLIAWPSEPKPAYYAVAAALKPTIFSIKAKGFAWTPGDLMACELIVVHDGTEPFSSAPAVVKVDGVEVWKGLAVLGSPQRIQFLVPAGRKGEVFEVQVNEERPYIFVRE
jgi:beta-mannosidase